MVDNAAKKTNAGFRQQLEVAKVRLENFRPRVHKSTGSLLKFEPRIESDIVADLFEKVKRVLFTNPEWLPALRDVGLRAEDSIRTTLADCKAVQYSLEAGVLYIHHIHTYQSTVSFACHVEEDGFLHDGVVILTVGPIRRILLDFEEDNFSPSLFPRSDRTQNHAARQQGVWTPLVPPAHVSCPGPYSIRGRKELLADWT